MGDCQAVNVRVSASNAHPKPLTVIMLVISLVTQNIFAQPVGVMHYVPQSLYARLFLDPEVSFVTKDDVKRNGIKMIRREYASKTDLIYYNSKGLLDSVVSFYDEKKKQTREMSIAIEYDSLDRPIKYRYSWIISTDIVYMIVYNDIYKTAELTEFHGNRPKPKKPFIYDTTFFDLRFFENGTFSESQYDDNHYYYDKNGAFAKRVLNGICQDSVADSHNGDSLFRNYLTLNPERNKYDTGRVDVMINNRVLKSTIFYQNSHNIATTVIYAYDINNRLVYSYADAKTSFFRDVVKTYVYNNLGLLGRELVASGNSLVKSVKYTYILAKD